MTIFYTALQKHYLYNCTCTLNINTELILKGPQYLICLCLRLCRSKKNSKETNALHLRNPGYPAYDFHAKAEILQSPKSRIFSSETRELKGPWSGLQELGPRAQPATLLRLSVIFIIRLVFSTEQYCPFQANKAVKCIQ